MSTHYTLALLRFTRRWFDEHIVCGTFEPLLADHEREWLNAPASRRRWLAIRTAFVFAGTLLRLAPRAVLLAPLPASVLGRTLTRIIVFTGVTSLLPARGVHELMFHELFLAPHRAVAGDRRTARSGAVEREIHQRTVLALLPALLVWVRWGSLARAASTPPRRWSAAVATGATVAVFFSLYFASVNIEPRLGLSPGAALWFPVAALLTWGTLARWRISRAAVRPC